MIRFYAIVFLLFPTAIFGQDINKSKITVNNYCDTIPFEYIRGKIIVNVEVNNQQKRFIFDTGAPCLISENLLHTTNAPVVGTGIITDVTGRNQQQQIVKVPELKLGNVPFTDVVAIVFDRQSTGLLDCFDFDGFIGSTLLKHCIVQINLEQKNIILTDRLTRLDLREASKSKIKLDGNSRPFIKLDLGQQGNLTALFDSGSDKFLPLSTEGYEKLNAKGDVFLVNEGYGSVSSGLFGAGKMGIERRIKIDNVFFGNAVIKDILTTVSEHKNKSAVGLALAKYGVITVDYLHKRFYFAPHSESQTFQELPFFGFNAQLINGVYTVSAVYKNTEAEKLGLRNGYRITKINDFDLSDNQRDSLCELFLSNYLERETMKVSFVDSFGNSNTIEIKGQ